MISAEKDGLVETGQTATRERPARSALTRTGGFLTGFSHTLQPYIGCRFGCSYCYVRNSSVHRFNSGGLEWGNYVYPRVGIAEQLERELKRLEERDQLAQTAVYMSSSTDPYQGAERRFLLTRRCLAGFLRRPPGLLVIQTRSPLAARDFDMMAALGDRCLLNVSLETDRDDVRRRLTPRCSPIGKRLAMVGQARAAGIATQVTVSPCLPYSAVETFGELLLSTCDRVVVDSFVAGDGCGGKRTARTDIPALYVESGWHDWQSQNEAHRLYQWLRDRIGERAGWSQDGFTRQARRVTGRARKLAVEKPQERSSLL